MYNGRRAFLDTGYTMGGDAGDALALSLAEGAAQSPIMGPIATFGQVALRCVRPYFLCIVNLLLGHLHITIGSPRLLIVETVEAAVILLLRMLMNSVAAG